MKAFRSRTSRWLTWLGPIIGAALVAPGCGGSSASSNSVQVWGRVTYNGKPVQYGWLVFQPTRTSKSNWAFGVISEGGKYSLAPSQSDVVLNPGRFEVYIRPPTVHDKYKRAGSDEEESDQLAIAIATFYPVPQRFFSHETSGLWVDIGDEPTRVDIDLRD
jgi:hypothetical protein